MEGANDKLVLEIWDNYLFFYKIIAKRLLFGLSPDYRKFKNNHYDSSVPEIFANSYQVLDEKYLKTGKITKYIDAKKVLSKIVYFQTLKFSEKYMDEAWYRKLRFSDRKNNLYPPSYYYHKKYLEKNREKINEQRRANYKKYYRNKVLAKRKQIIEEKKLSTPTN